MTHEKDTVGEQREPCPNCGVDGFKLPYEPDSDMYECANGNCAVHEFFYRGGSDAE